MSSVSGSEAGPLNGPLVESLIRYKCPHCDKVYCHERSFKKHFKVKHCDNSEVFACSTCSFIFTYKSALIRHVYNGQCGSVMSATPDVHMLEAAYVAYGQQEGRFVRLHKRSGEHGPCPDAAEAEQAQSHVAPGQVTGKVVWRVGSDGVEIKRRRFPNVKRRAVHQQQEQPTSPFDPQETRL